MPKNGMLVVHSQNWFCWCRIHRHTNINFHASSHACWPLVHFPFPCIIQRTLAFSSPHTSIHHPTHPSLNYNLPCNIIRTVGFGSYSCSCSRIPRCPLIILCPSLRNRRLHRLLRSYPPTPLARRRVRRVNSPGADGGRRGFSVGQLAHDLSHGSALLQDGLCVQRKPRLAFGACTHAHIAEHHPFLSIFMGISGPLRELRTPSIFYEGLLQIVGVGTLVALPNPTGGLSAVFTKTIPIIASGISLVCT